ncbi:MAG: GSCFA domain-containing protein [Flavobacteriaceae bacterium]|nr:GSCFA domain-containing protein [Flavobacteriaceae bacterium]
MNFRTKIPISKFNSPIDYSSKIVSLGSCFAVNMSEKLDYFKFQNSCNPFGILFHPLAIEKIISKVINKTFFTEEDVFFYNERWHCFDVHSDLSNANKDEFLQTLNELVKTTNKEIVEATHVIITYGTSWVYRSKQTEKVVANCYKLPQNQFNKEILSVATIEKCIQNTIDLIEKVNPKCIIIFTVSPVRHIKDGFEKNQRSKSNLISALHSIFDIRDTTKRYFPSYEIMMDELRDYRFYSEDMLHPTKVAIDYIWEYFSESAISDKAFSTMQEVETIQKGLLHNPFNHNSESHLNFLNQLELKISKLKSKFTFMKF